MKNIKITGRDIIETDGEDHTGALKELGVEYTYKGDGLLDSSICNLTFMVDLDFILRHGLMNHEIYEVHYKGSKEYDKYYNEGKQAFLDGKEENNPYNNKTIKDEDYWLNDHMVKACPWFDGYRETEKALAYKKYKLDEFQKEIRAVIEKYGLILEYTDEYGTPYVKTKEGYISKLC